MSRSIFFTMEMDYTLFMQDAVQALPRPVQRRSSPALREAKHVLCYAKQAMVITNFRHVHTRPVQRLVSLPLKGTPVKSARLFYDILSI